MEEANDQKARKRREMLLAVDEMIASLVSDLVAAGIVIG